MKKILIISVIILIIYLAVLFISWITNIITQEQLTSFSIKGTLVILILAVVGLLVSLLGKKQ